VLEVTIRIICTETLEFSTARETNLHELKEQNRLTGNFQSSQFPIVYNLILEQLPCGSTSKTPGITKSLGNCMQLLSSCTSFT
jgi:hypothetical protein